MDGSQLIWAQDLFVNLGGNPEHSPRPTRPNDPTQGWGSYIRFQTLWPDVNGCGTPALVTGGRVAS